VPSEYEPDEFDAIAQSGGPVGVHRAPRKWWARVLPLLIVFILAGLLAYALATVLWNGDNGSKAGTVSSPSPSVSATVSATPSPTASPPASAEPSVAPEPEPIVIYDAQVHIRNGSGVSGLAAIQQQALEDADYTNVEANNISSSLIPDGANTVTYTEDRLADTAEDIAATLGIDVVQGGDTPGGAEIEVLIASDPDA